LHPKIGNIDVNVVAMLLENNVGLNTVNKAGDSAAHMLMRKGKRRLWRHRHKWEEAVGLTSYVSTCFGQNKH